MGNLHHGRYGTDNGDRKVKERCKEIDKLGESTLQLAVHYPERDKPERGNCPSRDTCARIKLLTYALTKLT